MATDREMTERQERDMTEQLTDVLKAYAESDPGPNRITLAEWIGRYPHFARELTEFTARWQLLEWTADASLLPGGERLADDSASAERLVLRGVSAAQGIFYGKGAQDAEQSAQKPVAADPPISGLLREAQHIGIPTDVLAERVGLSDGLLRKLDRRLIDPASIPSYIFGHLAEVLGRSMASVVAYSQLPPAFAAGAQHRARQKPTLPGKQEDFFDAVRSDLVLDNARRQALLALPRPSAPEAGPHSTER